MDFLNNYPLVEQILQYLAIAMVAATGIIAITPSKKDDELLKKAKSGMLGKIFDFIERFSVVRRK